MNSGLIQIPENIKGEITIKLDTESLVKLAGVLIITVVFWGLTKIVTNKL